ncbi:PAS domain-containing sensor histidine kinase [Tistrella bauzanensis]|uniref:histidine kinase n=1 Tax=Tistrella arctica TaxID=3133430 RepID=A0ABU9YEX6_9PROT
MRSKADDARRERYAGRIAGSFGRRMTVLFARIRPGRIFTIALLVAALASGVATYLALTGLSFFGGNWGSEARADASTVFILLNVDLALLLLLVGVLAHGLIRLWLQRRRRSAGSRLQLRLVTLFALVAALPAIVVMVFSALFFDFGIQTWFNERVRTALNQSNAVARAYLLEHQRTIRADVIAMAADIDREALTTFDASGRLQRLLEIQAALRNLPEAMVFRGDGRILARSELSFSLEFATVPQPLLDQARRGDVVLLTDRQDDRVRALIQVQSLGDVFLYVGRFVDSAVLDHMEQVNRAVSQYDEAESRRSGIQLTFTGLFVLIALVLLLAAVWIGFLVARSIARPMSQLVGAAERVRSGDLRAQVPEGREDDEVGILARAFNRMTRQLAAQREALLAANRQIDTRRRFTEKVLEGVSAGVIGLDADHRVNLANRSALSLLGLDFDQAVDRPMVDLLPALEPLLARLVDRPDRVVQAQIEADPGGRHRNLMVRLAADIISTRDSGPAAPVGVVITFDDITDLMVAQRTAAWSDVARRIAHEIKNPLTPIQLSAERLKRRYLKEITSDPDTFVACTDTIIRQVGDIGRMVNEFSSFARMPQPVMADVDLGPLVREAVITQRLGRPELGFEFTRPDVPVLVRADSRLLGQALTNLLVNAGQAVDTIAETEGVPARDLPPERRRIVVAIEALDRLAQITVADAGRGLPESLKGRLTEPYVTTKAKGTGLGLAIVRKIMEDHGGRVSIDDRRDSDGRILGAVATLELPLAAPVSVAGAVTPEIRPTPPSQDGPISEPGSTRP